MDREEEILSVQAIYCDEFNTFTIIDDTHFEFHSSPVILSIYVPLSYPRADEAPRVSLDSNGLGISRMQLSQLQSHLEMLIHAKHVAQELVLFDITEDTREFTAEVRGDIALMYDEEEEEQEDIYVDEADEPKDTRISDAGVIRGHMGKVTLDSIMSRLPSSLKLLHAEIVLRSDLRNRYLSMRQKVQHSASSVSNSRDRRTRDAMYDKFGEEHIVFHGTMRQNVGSIVKSGFIVPGSKARDGTQVSVRCGTTWGQGIYTSPEPSYSLSYTDYTETNSGSRLLPGQKLIVSVVVLGRQLNMTSYERRHNTEVTEGYHSHISPNKMEYVVFNTAQVLPLYVLHLANKSAGLTKTELGYRMPVVADSRGHLGVQSRASMTEYARKYLPNGFGPMRGTKFVVEAIADVDDDEEMWGEYQYDEGEFQEERKSRDRYW